MIKIEYPPNYDDIAKVFDLKGHTPIFAWAPWIYNPHKTSIGLELIAHEIVHVRRQGIDPGAWWRRYLADENFRLAEEILAHVAEYEVLCQQAKTRADRRKIMHYICARLCSPLYGYKPRVPYDRARQFMKMALKEGSKPAPSIVEQQTVNPNAM
jgi:hypothetical protein